MKSFVAIDFETENHQRVIMEKNRIKIEYYQ